MLTKRSLIVLLVGLNLALLALLVIGTYSSPAAFAQIPRGSGDWVAVSAKAQGQAYDVVYLLDHGEQKLYALDRTNVRQKHYEPVAFRNLAKDFE
jgi:hypothetical protein